MTRIYAGEAQKEILKLEIWPISSLFFEGYYCESGINSWNEKYPRSTWTPTLTGTVNLISSDPLATMAMSDLQRYSLKICPIKYELKMHIFFIKTVFVHLWVFYFRICCLKNTMEKFTEIEHFELEKMLSYASRLRLWIRHWYFCMEGPL